MGESDESGASVVNTVQSQRESRSGEQQRRLCGNKLPGSLSSSDPTVGMVSFPGSRLTLCFFKETVYGKLNTYCQLHQNYRKVGVHSQRNKSLSDVSR